MRIEVTSALLFFVSFSSISKGFPVAEETSPSQQVCPSNPEAWGAWRAQLLSGFPGETITDQGLIARCTREAPQALADKNVKACLAPLIEAMKTATSSASAADYAKISATTTFLSPPPGIDMSRLTRGSTEEKQAEVMKILNTYPEARIIRRDSSYDNQELGPHNAEVNFLVMIPGGKVDRYLNVGRGVSLIAIDREGDHQAYFAAVDASSGHVNSGPGETQKCALCHRTGAMPVLDRSDTYGKLTTLRAGDSTEKTRDWFNDRVIRTADAKNFGTKMSDEPGFGETAAISRSIDFLKACANVNGAALSTQSLRKIHNAMDCSGCHNGRSGGAGEIKWPFSAALMAGHLESGHMPPGSLGVGNNNSLTVDERKALLRCLNDEYFGGLGSPAREGAPSGILAQYLNPPACKAITPAVTAAPAPAGQARGAGEIEATEAPKIQSKSVR